MLAGAPGKPDNRSHALARFRITSLNDPEHPGESEGAEPGRLSATCRLAPARERVCRQSCRNLLTVARRWQTSSGCTSRTGVASARAACSAKRTVPTLPPLTRRRPVVARAHGHGSSSARRRSLRAVVQDAGRPSQTRQARANEPRSPTHASVDSPWHPSTQPNGHPFAKAGAPAVAGAPAFEVACG